MTLDGAGQLGADAHAEGVPAKHRPRLSAPGCAMLALLLRFPQVRLAASVSAVFCSLLGESDECRA